MPGRCHVQAANKACSAKAKALVTLVQGHQQPLPQIFLGVILEQVQLIEAGMCAWQAVAGTIGLVDLEALRP